jgi:L-ascorbate metabolism protein UlaG (beta-lactamase superfamily)
MAAWGIEWQAEDVGETLGAMFHRARLPFDKTSAEAVRAHQDLGSKQSIGMHFGTFQLITEAIDQPQADLKLALSESGIPENRFVTLQEGETRSFPAD